MPSTLKLLLGLALATALHLGVALMPRTAPAGVPCAQQDTAVCLKTLRVTNCLLAPLASSPVTPGVMQRVENISGMDVVVELPEDYFNSEIVYVIGAESVISRTMAPPRLHDPTYVAPRLLAFPLKAGESVVFKAAIPDLLVRQPRASERYTAYMHTDMAYRYVGEPVGRGFSLRQAETIRYGIYMPGSKFEGVVLR